MGNTSGEPDPLGHPTGSRSTTASDPDSTAWGESTGASAAGITFIADYRAELTRALGMEFTAPPIGLVDRSNRYALFLEDGVVTIANVDEPAVCDISTGEKFLERMAS